MRSTISDLQKLASSSSDYETIRTASQRLVHACRAALKGSNDLESGVKISSIAAPPKGDDYRLWRHYEEVVTVMQLELETLTSLPAIKRAADRLVYVTRKAEYYCSRLETTESGEIVILHH